MQGVILAAGVGSRLQSLSGGAPKCLIDIGGRPLILHQLESFADHGVGPVTIVVGYRADDVRKIVGERAHVVVNERYAETNSLYSLFLARQQIDGEFVLANSDLFFDPRILGKLLREKGSALAYDSTSSRGREQTKVAVRGGRVTDLGKDLPPSLARGESLGLVKFDKDGAAVMLDTAADLVGAGHDDAWVLEGTRSVAARHPIAAVNIAGLPWAEIDFPHDLDVARREVWPVIHRNRWRSRIHVRRAQWVAVTAAAVALALFGWYANSHVGPASKDWETVPLEADSLVPVTREGNAQSWAFARTGDSVFAIVNSPIASVETRLVIPPQRRADYRYVIAVTVDGEPFTWKSHAARFDTTAVVPIGAVTRRDRVTLDLPAGTHRIGVRLLDGHGEAVLVRVREREESEGS